MKQWLQSLALSVLCLAAAACRPQGQDGTVTVPDNISSKSLLPLIRSVEVIPLETREDDLLGTVSLYPASDGYIAVDARNLGTGRCQKARLRRIVHAIRTRPDTAGLTAALERGDLAGAARRMYNVFEDALPRSAGEIAAIRGKLLDAGALGAIMTGTGSAVYGVFDRIETAETAFAFLKREYRECFLTRPVARLDVGRTGEPYGRIE